MTFAGNRSANIVYGQRTPHARLVLYMYLHYVSCVHTLGVCLKSSLNRETNNTARTRMGEAESQQDLDP